MQGRLIPLAQNNLQIKFENKKEDINMMIFIQTLENKIKNQKDALEDRFGRLKKIFHILIVAVKVL